MIAEQPWRARGYDDKRRVVARVDRLDESPHPLLVVRALASEQHHVDRDIVLFQAFSELDELFRGEGFGERGAEEYDGALTLVLVLAVLEREAGDGESGDEVRRAVCHDGRERVVDLAFFSGYCWGDEDRRPLLRVSIELLVEDADPPFAGKRHEAAGALRVAAPSSAPFRSRSRGAHDWVLARKMVLTASAAAASLVGVTSEFIA